MLTLIRYEMKKTMPIKLVSVALLLIFEVLLLFGSISGNIFVMGLSGMFLIFFSFVVFLLFGLSSMVSLSKDLSTNQGYMLYMLPRPSYQFLLAKIVESLISSICIGLFLYFLFLFDLFYFSVDIDGFSHTFDMIWGLTVENKLGNFVQFIISIGSFYVGVWIYMCCLAVLCVTVQASFFRGKMLAFIITIFIFLILAVNILSGVTDFVDSIRNIFGISADWSMYLQVLVLSLISLLCFGAASYVLEKNRNY